ncbi:Mth938-like domain-containing protein [Ehrlichia sp. JZT12]
MDITPIICTNQNVITGYGTGKFLINDNVYLGSHIVFPNKIISYLNLSISNLEDIIGLLDTALDIVLVGTGKDHIFLPNEVKNNFLKKGFNLEHMSTGAVCRTYNVLLYEGRNICAALISL